MKKIIVGFAIVLSVFTLASCKAKDKEVEEIVFNGETYELIGVTDDEYDLFDFDGHRVEVSFIDDEIILSTEIDEDIFIVSGDSESYQIRKNGETLLLCSGDPTVCSGFEDVSWKLDILDIIEAYRSVK